MFPWLVPTDGNGCSTVVCSHLVDLYTYLYRLLNAPSLRRWRTTWTATWNQRRVAFINDDSPKHSSFHLRLCRCLRSYILVLLLLLHIDDAPEQRHLSATRPHRHWLQRNELRYLLDRMRACKKSGHSLFYGRTLLTLRYFLDKQNYDVSADGASRGWIYVYNLQFTSYCTLCNKEVNYVEFDLWT